MFEQENLQAIIEAHFTADDDKNILFDLEEHPKGNIYMVAYDVTGAEYDFVNPTELDMYCFEKDIYMEDFVVNRVLIKSND